VIASGYDPGVGRLVDEERAEAVVVDCSAWEMSQSLFDSLRSRPEHVRLPVVVISDTPEKADAALLARRAQRVLLVPKPFTGSQVARALEELLAPPPEADPSREE